MGQEKYIGFKGPAHFGWPKNKKKKNKKKERGKKEDSYYFTQDG